MSVIKPVLLHPELIAYFAGANNYCWLYFRNGEKKLLAKPISYLESKLPDFIRVHKTALINPAYIKSLHEPPHKKMAGKVHLDTGEIFPVSRRRWQYVAETLQGRHSLPNDTNELSRSAVDNVNSLTIQPHDSSTRSIFFITNDTEKAIQTEQLIMKKWPAYQFYTTPQSTLLPDLLQQLPEQEYPTLLLLDASTTTLERLHTLRRLKEDNRFSHIPVILLVSPTDQLVINGYQQQANSVVTMPTEYILFEQMIERICQFWLRIVALPGAGK